MSCLPCSAGACRPLCHTLLVAYWEDSRYGALRPKPTLDPTASDAVFSCHAVGLLALALALAHGPERPRRDWPRREP